MTESESPTAQPAPLPDSALPLEELELTPEWVKTSGKSHADYQGPEREPRRDGRRPNRERFQERDGERRPRPPRPQRPPGSAGQSGPRPERRQGGPRSGPPRERVADHRPRPHSPPPLPLLEVTFQPEEKGFAAMVEAMKQAPRAYALFDVAKLVLNKPERHHVKLSRKAPAGPAPAELAPLFLVLPGENVFLKQEDAVRFALRQHAAMIFKEKKTVVDPPKGNFTFVNRCSFTGVWLGPPNYHEYQSRLIRHHQQRLRHIPFAEFQARIQTVRDPAAVQAWVDSMSAKTEYECLLDTEPKVFPSRDELEKHFFENHIAQFVTSAPELRVSGAASRQFQNPMLVEVVRLAWLEERKFPMKTANEMRGRFRHEGFHFFKDPKGITYISHIKPQRFESIGHLSDRIQKIIVYLRQHFGCKRRHLVEHLLPQPPAPTAPVETAVVADAPPPVPETMAAAPTGSAPEVTAGTPPAPAPEASTTAPATPPSEAGATAPTPVQLPSEQDQLLADLHWLIHEGYIVEFSDGRLWALADKPPPPPPKPAPAPASESAQVPTTAAPAENTPASPAVPLAETAAESSPVAQPVATATDGVPPEPSDSVGS